MGPSRTALGDRPRLGYCAAAFTETVAMRRAAAAIVLGAFLVSGWAWAQLKSGKGGYEQLTLFNEAFERIRQDAVEPVAEGKLIGAAIAGMLSGLDARSAYINEAAFKATQAPANDDAVSVGL